jgi:acyl-coenzyme A thioesterase PaaI-like protein
MNLKPFIDRAAHSNFHRWILNVALNYVVPFNKPHGFEVVSIEDFRLKTRIPYKRRNFNHIKGLHACALATLSEFTTGFLLLSNLGVDKYRIIMQRLEMDYHYQGKMDAFGEFVISNEWLETNIYTPLEAQDSTVIVCEIHIHDSKGNHLTTGRVHWQVKSWKKVKTQIR